MLPKDLYGQAHLFAAAVRIVEHLSDQPPSLKSLSELLLLSEEEISRISRKLEEAGIIGVITSGGENRFLIRNIAKIEELPDHRSSPAWKTRYRNSRTSRNRD